MGEPKTVMSLFWLMFKLQSPRILLPAVYFLLFKVHYYEISCHWHWVVFVSCMCIELFKYIYSVCVYVNHQRKKVCSTSFMHLMTAGMYQVLRGDALEYLNCCLVQRRFMLKLSLVLIYMSTWLDHNELPCGQTSLWMLLQGHFSWDHAHFDYLDYSVFSFKNSF